jgi:hypothetical protein
MGGTGFAEILRTTQPNERKKGWMTQSMNRRKVKEKKNNETYSIGSDQILRTTQPNERKKRWMTPSMNRRKAKEKKILNRI